MKDGSEGTREQGIEGVYDVRASPVDSLHPSIPSSDLPPKAHVFSVVKEGSTKRLAGFGQDGPIARVITQVYVTEARVVCVSALVRREKNENPRLRRTAGLDQSMVQACHIMS